MEKLERKKERKKMKVKRFKGHPLNTHFLILDF